MMDAETDLKMAIAMAELRKAQAFGHDDVRMPGQWTLKALARELGMDRNVLRDVERSALAKVRAACERDEELVTMLEYMVGAERCPVELQDGAEGDLLNGAGAGAKRGVSGEELARMAAVQAEAEALEGAWVAEEMGELF